MALAFGIASALRTRDRTGEGSVVDVSLLATAMWTLSSDLLAALNGGKVRRAKGRGPQPNPLVGTYRTKDDRHLQLVFLQPDRYWAELCKVLGRPELETDPRFVDISARRENAAACIAELDAAFATRTLDEWKVALAEIDAPWAPVQRVEDLVDDPQVVANDYVGDVEAAGYPTYRLPRVPIQFDEQPPPLQPAPEHGEHTEMVLLDLGYDWDGISALKDTGVIL